MVRVTAYRYPYGTPTSVIIGAPGEAWNNRLVEISTSPDQPFDTLDLSGVNSPDDLLGFCADDLTVNLIPEPSSLLALGGGLMGLGLLRRRVTSKR
jgi:hypothetical protein